MLPERLRAKPLEELTGEEAKQVFGESFAREAWRDGLDTRMNKGTWEQAGKRMFGAFYDREVLQCLVNEVRDLTEVGDVLTLYEIAALLTCSTATNFESSARKDQIERAIDRAAGWERTTARVCPLIGLEVTQVWRRTA